MTTLSIRAKLAGDILRRVCKALNVNPRDVEMGVRTSRVAAARTAWIRAVADEFSTYRLSIPELAALVGITEKHVFTILAEKAS